MPLSKYKVTYVEYPGIEAGGKAHTVEVAEGKKIAAETLADMSIPMKQMA